MVVTDDVWLFVLTFDTMVDLSFYTGFSRPDMKSQRFDIDIWLHIKKELEVKSSAKRH